MPISLIEALNRLATKRNLPAAHEILQKHLPWWVKC